MQVINRGIPQELTITTISLVPMDNTVYLFRCTYCGEAIEQYVGRVAKIVPMLEPSNDVTTISKCKCGKMYTFQTHAGYDGSVIRTTLRGEAIQHSFLCCRCRGAIVEYSNTKFVDLINYLLHTLPFELTCQTPECNFTYMFTDVVE